MVVILRREQLVDLLHEMVVDLLRILTRHLALEKQLDRTVQTDDSSIHQLANLNN